MIKDLYLELPENAGDDLVRLLNDRMRRLGTRLQQCGTAIEDAGMLISCTHLERQQNRPASAYTEDTLLWETDRGPVWAVQLVGRTHVWKYLTGLAELPYAQRFTDLGVDDAGFPFRASDWKVKWRWSGTAWVYIEGVYENTFANRPGGLAVADAGLLFRASDWKVKWRWNGTDWAYREGVYENTLANQPTALGAADEGFLYHLTTGTAEVEYYHTLMWNGTGWEPAERERMGGFFEDSMKVPTDKGWKLCDGSDTKYLEITEGELEEIAISLPDMTTGVQRVSGSSYSGQVSNIGDTGIAIALPAVHNLVPYSEEFDQWWKENKPGENPFPPINVTPDDALNPAATEMTADKVDFTVYPSPALAQYYISRGFRVTRGMAVVFSVWLKTPNPTETFKLQLSIFEPEPGGYWSANSVSSGELTITDTWAQYTVSLVTPLTGPTDYYFKVAIGGCLEPAYNLPASGAVHAWGAQVNAGSSIGDYVKTGPKAEVGNWFPDPGDSEGTVPVGEEKKTLTTLPYFRQ